MNFQAAASVIRNHKLYFTVSLCTLSGAILYNYLRNNGHLAKYNRGAIQPGKLHEEKLIVENEHVPKLKEAIKDIEHYTATRISFSTNNKTNQSGQGPERRPHEAIDLGQNESSMQSQCPAEEALGWNENPQPSNAVGLFNMETLAEKSTHQICTITGRYTDVKEARYMLLKEIERLSIVKEEISFSKDIYRKFYNNECEVVQELNRITSAKVDTNFAVETDTRKMRITVSGNKHQVGIARRLIEATVKGWEIKTLSDKNPESGLEGPEAKFPPLPLNGSGQIDESERFFEVNVSALASPSRFWIQLVNSNGSQLEEFMVQMGAFYEVPLNRRNLQLSNPQIGQLVAAFFPRDSRWYRAEIVALIPQSRDNSDEFRYDVFFVDFGNSEFLLPCYVFELHERFKNISYQAAECFLVNVNPMNPTKPDHWEEDATCFFENLTDNINGKKIICQVLTYKERCYKIGNIKRNLSAAGIELYYTQDDMIVNIGQMMISNGFARPSQKQYSTAHDAEMLQEVNQVSHDKSSKNSKNYNVTKGQSPMVDSNKFFKYEDQPSVRSATVRATEATTTKTTSTTTWRDESFFSKAKRDNISRTATRGIF